MVAVPLAGAMQSRQDAGNYQVEFEGEMIETTDAELEKLIAEKIMGWRYGYKIDSVGRRALWWMTMGNLCDNSVYMVGVSKWHPLKSADQIFMAVDKFLEADFSAIKLACHFITHDWWATLFSGDGRRWQAVHSDRLHAIGLALLKITEVQSG